MLDPRKPQFTSGDVVEATSVPAPLLQQWLNRGEIPSSQKSRGIGYDRMLSAGAAAGAAVRHCGLSITSFALSRLLGDETRLAIDNGGNIEWELIVPITPLTLQIAERSRGAVSTPPFAAWGADRRDPAEVTLAELIEGRDLRGRRKQGRVEPDVREQLALAGRHAQPVLIFPLGEIVNATLLRLEAIAARKVESVPA